MKGRAAVIDCSAVVRALVEETSAGTAVRNRLSQADEFVASTLLDYELMSVLLGMSRCGKLAPRKQVNAMAAYKAMNIEFHSTLGLWERVRELYSNLSAYDGQYVALAEALDLPLITCDARIARSGVAKCAIEVFD